MKKIYPVGEWNSEIENRLQYVKPNTKKYHKGDRGLQELFLIKQSAEDNFSNFKESIEEMMWEYNEKASKKSPLGKSQNFMDTSPEHRFQKSIDYILSSIKEANTNYVKYFKELNKSVIDLDGLPENLDYLFRLN